MTTGTPEKTVTRKAVMLAAADLIEQEGRYNFDVGSIPSDCNDVGCVLGWIAYCAGTTPDQDSQLRPAARYVGYDEPYDFYEDMNRGCGGSYDWLDNAGLAAIGLRKLAEEI